MGKWCGNTGCEEQDSKEPCGCRLHGDYAYDCIDFIDGNVGKPTLSEVLSEMEPMIVDFVESHNEDAVREYLREKLGKYFA